MAKKVLVKMIKALNKLDLTEDAVSIKGDEDELQEAFIEAIEEIDDDNNIDEVSDKIIDFYESLIDEGEEEEEEEEEEKPKKKKKGKKAKKGKGKKAKKGKGKKGKKAKKEKKEKVDLPKGLRTGTMPALLYSAIKDNGEVTWEELAEVVAEEKDKEVDSCMGIAMRVVSRKVSKAVPITLTFNGEDTTAVFTLAEEEEEEDDD